MTDQPWMMATANARSHIRRYGIDKLDKQTLRILRGHVSEDITRHQAIWAELMMVRSEAQSAAEIKKELDEARILRDQIDLKLL